MCVFCMEVKPVRLQTVVFVSTIRNQIRFSCSHSAIMLQSRSSIRNVQASKQHRSNAVCKVVSRVQLHAACRHSRRTVPQIIAHAGPATGLKMTGVLQDQWCTLTSLEPPQLIALLAPCRLCWGDACCCNEAAHTGAGPERGWCGSTQASTGGDTHILRLVATFDPCLCVRGVLWQCLPQHCSSWVDSSCVVKCGCGALYRCVVQNQTCS
jgi:hypothetical protein